MATLSIKILESKVDDRSQCRDWTFEQIGMNKLTALHDKDNPASGKVMEKSVCVFPHEEPYARMDNKEPGRMITRFIMS